jgi:regulator of protease activity HflC (stomatin/prohibitin superfamily)
MGLFVFGLVLVVVGILLALFGKLRIPSAPNRSGMSERRVSLRAAGIAVTALGAVLAVGSSARLIGATDVGVPVTLGKVGAPLRSGVHFVAPWTQVSSFSTRLQQSDMSQTAGEGDRTGNDGVEVLSSEGGRMVLDVTVRYSVKAESAATLFRQVGSMNGIREQIVRPDVRSRLRDVYSRYTADEGYAAKREKVASEAEAEVRERLTPFGLVIDAVKVRNITLETNLQSQITAKLEAKQAAERALIEQQKAQTEAETRRKVAETDAQASVAAARGQAEANTILAQSLTPELLKAREIEAITKNTNTVLYPYGQPVTPIVDGRGASGAPSPTPAAAAAAATPTTTPATTAATTPPTTVKPGG